MFLPLLNKLYDMTNVCPYIDLLILCVCLYVCETQRCNKYWLALCSQNTAITGDPVAYTVNEILLIDLYLNILVSFWLPLVFTVILMFFITYTVPILLTIGTKLFDVNILHYLFRGIWHQPSCRTHAYKYGCCYMQ